VTTILADPTNTTTGVPDVLRAAADQLQALPYLMVGRIEIHRALLNAGPTVQLAQDALTAVLTYLPADDRGIDRWMHRRTRDSAAALLRHIADTVQAPAIRIATVLRQAARHVAQPVNASLPEALRIVTRDETLAGQAAEMLARTLRLHPRDLPLWDVTRSRSDVADMLTVAALLIEHDATAEVIR
jgi:hypothetical protein